MGIRKGITKNLGLIIGHYHIATKEITDTQIVDEAMKCFEYIKKIISKPQ